MKKASIILTALCFIGLPFYSKAQDVKEEKIEKVEKKEKIEKKEKGDRKENKETQEIVIRNKGGKELNLKVEINGDKITVNGKPLDEFIDNDVSINNRKMIIRDGENNMSFDFAPGDINFDSNFMGQWKGKEISRPFLGVTTEKADGGAKITQVIKESAAEKAGLKTEDIITKVGDQVITDGDKLSNVIGAKKAKEVVVVTYLRNGKEGTIKATLGERKIKTPMAYAFNGPRAKVRSFSMPRISGDRLDEEDALRNYNGGESALGYLAPYADWDNSLLRQKKLGLKIQDTEEGANVKVIEVEEGSAAEKAGLKKDDIITEIGGEKIENTDDAREHLMPSEEKKAYTIKAKRNGTEMSFEVKFPKKLKTANL